MDITELIGDEGETYARNHLVRTPVYRKGRWETAYECPLLDVLWVREPLPSDRSGLRLLRLSTLTAA